ncbi:hypothetical protein AYI68_g4394 [Smittium mucronatum]|uniref:Uncharacterized protein n=1 Tax=Smittium mucronatum TaxID=133383 RepID=A0A1R0GX77_9FUNG|nr:hypothetical protein AYI68_g4394 [Smittium mucronatum]
MQKRQSYKAYEKLRSQIRLCLVESTPKILHLLSFFNNDLQVLFDSNVQDIIPSEFNNTQISIKDLKEGFEIWVFLVNYVSTLLKDSSDLITQEKLTLVSDNLETVNKKMENQSHKLSLALSKTNPIIALNSEKISVFSRSSKQFAAINRLSTLTNNINSKLLLLIDEMHSSSDGSDFSKNQITDSVMNLYLSIKDDVDILQDSYSQSIPTFQSQIVSHEPEPNCPPKFQDVFESTDFVGSIADCSVDYFDLDAPEQIYEATSAPSHISIKKSKLTREERIKNAKQKRDQAKPKDSLETGIDMINELKNVLAAKHSKKNL